MKQVAFAYSFQGASHRRKEEKSGSLGRKFPCQDRAFAGDFESSGIEEKKEVTLFIKDNSSPLSSVMLPVELNPHELSFSVACVSDGHGGVKYFRSQRGAEFAVQTAIELLCTSIDKIAAVLEKKDLATLNKTLGNSFVRRWRRKVLADFAVTDKTEMERQLDDLKEQDETAWQMYQADLEQADGLAEKYKETKNKLVESAEQREQEIKSLQEEFSKLEIKSMYGCTVAVYFKIKDSPRWYAFKVGDSDILLSFDGEDENFFKPIADDSKCDDNVTTSLCDDDVRFCFPDEEYLDKIPKTVFCSSDGVADSFKKGFLEKFYSGLQFSFDEDGLGKAEQDIQLHLPQLSEKGSGDDVSLAGLVAYDDSDEVKQYRRKTVWEKAKCYCENGEFDLIEPLFKPYLDRNDSHFKYLLAFYEYKRIESLFPSARDNMAEFHSRFLATKKKLNDCNDTIPKTASNAYVQKIQKIINGMKRKLDSMWRQLGDEPIEN